MASAKEISDKRNTETKQEDFTITNTKVTTHKKIRITWVISCLVIVGSLSTNNLITKCIVKSSSHIFDYIWATCSNPSFTVSKMIKD